VIAYGRQLDPSAKLDARDTARTTVATLLATQDQAQRLVLAGQRGRIQLVLRNGLDDQVDEFTGPIASRDLVIQQPPNTQPVRPPPPTPAPAKAKTEESVHVIRIYRGDKVTEEKLR